MSRSHKKMELNPRLSEYVFCPEEDCDELIEVTFYPGYAAPAASNHDDPRFSDPGGGAEIDSCPETCPACGATLDEDKMLDLALARMDSRLDGEDEGPEWDKDDD